MTDCAKRPSRTDYETEKIEAYNVAALAYILNACERTNLRMTPMQLRHRLADKLDREIQRWCNRRGLE